MGPRVLLALLFVLLLVGLEVQGAPVVQADEGSPAMLESLFQYWSSAKSTAKDLYQKTYLPNVNEKIREMYSKSTAAVTTYAGIFTDQLLTMLKGEQ
ncbi:PREDICTED: apolipoprotein C-II [Elephantulus edwardii]|uniref:apolipoprotein C-II n=1 Tax=Elephantulus edwardii TaxID=28737 RepID=UPI0003F0E2C6|nr:PREDICTED: apolipoprotein C-II [Elephantulus edwardii]